MYELYKYKPYVYGFVVLCPNCNVGHLKNTVNSIELYYPGKTVTVVLPDTSDKESFSTVSKFSKPIRGGKTLASMINSGIAESHCKEWNFIIITMGWIRSRLDLKYSYFIENEKDILYPIINKKMTFMDSEINGLLLHKRSFKEIGDFPDTNSLETSKLIWAESAIKHNCKFKGIVGAKAF